MGTQTYVVASVAGATLIVAGANLAKGDTPPVRVFLGGTIAAFALSVAAGPLPGIARGLATLAILGALLTSGYDLVRPLAAAVRN